MPSGAIESVLESMLGRVLGSILIVYQRAHARAGWKWVIEYSWKCNRENAWECAWEHLVRLLGTI